MTVVGDGADWWALWCADRYGNFHVVDSGLTFEQALAVRDDSYDARGIATPGRYVTDRMDLLAAHEIADRVLDDLVDSHTSLTFSKTRLKDGSPLYWFFVRDCDEWIADGKIPGTLSCAIDKVDGTIWTDDRQEAFLLAQRPDEADWVPLRGSP